MRSAFKISFILLFLFISCSEDGDKIAPPADSFDRKGMLTNWADNIIIPSFQSFKGASQNLENAVQSFTANPSISNLEALRAVYKEAYLQFQTVSMFEIGKAESLNYRARLNTYPTDVTAIQAKLDSGNYNLELPTSFDEQGFPAIDYLINGISETDQEIVDFYSSHTNAANNKKYLVDLSKSINSLTNTVLNDWTSSYRDTFVNNLSSSSTGSVDKLTNDFIMYYEKFLRSGKIGIPSGIFTGNPVPQNVESYYSSQFSKELYLKALQSVQDFFNGNHFSSSQDGPGFDDYLGYLNSIKNGQELDLLINNQFDAIKAQASNLDNDFVKQIQTNNNVMLAAFDELQKNVILLKVDMMQALSISVDYVDSDGD